MFFINISLGSLRRGYIGKNWQASEIFAPQIPEKTIEIVEEYFWALPCSVKNIRVVVL